MPAIEVQGVVKDYPGCRALHGIDLTVDRGEIVGLLGPNGAGKSTLMRILCGVLGPTAGTARIKGFDVVTESLEVRRHVGYLPESAPRYHDIHGVAGFEGFHSAFRFVKGESKRAWACRRGDDFQLPVIQVQVIAPTETPGVDLRVFAVSGHQCQQAMPRPVETPGVSDGPGVEGVC